MLVGATIGFLAGLVFWGYVLLSLAGGFGGLSTISSVVEELESRNDVDCAELATKTDLSQEEITQQLEHCAPTGEDAGNAGP